MICKNCGQEIDNKAVICTKCGRKIKKPFYKKWWFWVIAAVIVISVISGGGGNESSTNDISSEPVATEEIVYEAVDFQKMLDELSDNAMKAEKNYQKKNIEIKCQIKNFDSDGKYISVEPVGASEWNFVTAMCYIKSDEQKNFLIEKNVGDVITIKGYVKSIGEVMGYSIDIKEVY